MLRDLATLPVTSPAHRYLLVEVADECRHRPCSASSSAGPARRRTRPPPTPRPSTPWETPPAATRSATYSILAVEELLDSINRATMKDDRIHPVSWQIAKLHVLEEAAR